MAVPDQGGRGWCFWRVLLGSRPSERLTDEDLVLISESALMADHQAGLAEQPPPVVGRELVSPSKPTSRTGGGSSADPVVHFLSALIPPGPRRPMTFACNPFTAGKSGSRCRRLSESLPSRFARSRPSRFPCFPPGGIQSPAACIQIGSSAALEVVDLLESIVATRAPR